MKVNVPNKNLHRYRKYKEKCNHPFGFIRYLNINNFIEVSVIRFENEKQGVFQLNELEKSPIFKRFL